MSAFYPMLVLFLWASPTNQISRDLTYDELKELDAECYMLDSCNVRRTSDSLDKYTCQCDSYCSKQETCCIDSPFRDSKKTGQSQTCTPVNGEHKAHYFMVDQCSPRNTDRHLEERCREEWNEEDGLLPTVPVTSISSNVTYKNYFCFRCNEETDDFLYWNVRVDGNVTLDHNPEQESVPTYDSTRRTWMATVGHNHFPVQLFYEIPHNIKQLQHRCITDAISHCSGQWRISDVKRKCSMYTSYVYIEKDGINVGYRNPHCALCNFESLEKMRCGVPAITRTDSTRPFSFTLLLDINLSDGDKVGQIERCDAKSVWDPYFKKCRSYACALPGYTYKDGRCTPP